MNRISLKLLTVCGITCFMACTTTQKPKTEKWSERMARSEMKRFPEPWMIEKASKPRWGYTHGLVVKSMLEEWKHTGDSTYYDYAKIYADSLIDNDGHIRTMKYLSFNIDNVNAGKILFDFYAQTGDERYKIAMDTLRKQMREQPRTSEGGFWHKLRYPHQMWLDGIFMASPYLAQYGATFGEPTLQDEAVKQILLIARKTYNPATGLYYHGWDESREQKWASRETGCSPNFWSRSIGWYGAAIVDVLDYLPQETEGRDSVLQILQGLAQAMVRYQDPQSGTWYQVTDQGARKGNYLESSCSAMFIYSLFKAVRMGYIDPSYLDVAKAGYEGFLKNFIEVDKDGVVTITKACAVAGLGGKVYRSGDYDYYINETIRNNDPKAVGPFIMASLEYERLQK